MKIIILTTIIFPKFGYVQNSRNDHSPISYKLIPISHTELAFHHLVERVSLSAISPFFFFFFLFLYISIFDYYFSIIHIFILK